MLNKKITPLILLVVGVGALFCAPLMPTYTPEPVDSEDYGWAIGQVIAASTTVIVSWILLAIAVAVAIGQNARNKTRYSVVVLRVSVVSLSLVSVLGMFVLVFFSRAIMKWLLGV